MAEPDAASDGSVTTPTVDDQNSSNKKVPSERKKKPLAPAPRDVILRFLSELRTWPSTRLEDIGVGRWRWRILGAVLLLPPLPEGLSASELTDIVDAFLAAHKNVRCIVALDGKINGELRTPQVTLLTPQASTETIHTENGIQFKVRCPNFVSPPAGVELPLLFAVQLDVTKVMFAAGNGTERMRFAEFDVKGQVVVDMFAGIGYFTLPVAKYGRPSRLIALEKNPDSAHFLRQNIVLNKVSDIVTVYEGDNRETALEWLGRCDRVFMGYLPSAEPFIERALQLANPQRCIVHYHYFASKEDAPAVPEAHLLPHLDVIGRKATSSVTVLHIENVKNYAPHLWHFVADVLIVANG